jgi:hypothetical protein
VSSEIASGSDSGQPTQDELAEVARALRGLRFGSVNIVVQDGVVIQVERTEKRRLRPRRDSAKHGC